MDQQAMIENLRWWGQIYFWLAIGVPIAGAIVGGVLNMKRQHIEGQIRELREQLTQAELKTLHTQSQDLQQHVAEARQQQAAAEQELRRVQEQQRARTLTLEQRHTLIQRLREGPKGSVHIRSNAGDAEADHFAAYFYDALVRAGWPKPKYSQSTLIGSPLPVGLKVHPSQESAALPPHGELLLQALRDVGLEVSLDRITHQEPAEIVHLVVGAKPQPRQ
jgi:hypothetical protein